LKLAAALFGVAALLSLPVRAQQLDLSHGGPIDITAQGGIEWRQAQQEVIASGDARAVRDNVTVTADRLIAWYRKKGTVGAPQAQQAAAGAGGEPSTEGNEVYRLQAEGHVHIYTATDQAFGDKATYDMDEGVLVLTGHDLRLITPNEYITARDDLEYWPPKHMAVARGDAVVLTKDQKRIAGDTLVAYTTDNPPPGQTAAASGHGSADHGSANHGLADPLAASGKLQRVEAFGHVSVRTPTDTVTGDRAVYVISSGRARIVGNVHITRGQNQLNGAEADVNMKTGIATLVALPRERVRGLVLPNDASNRSLGNDPAAGLAAPPPTPSAKAPASGLAR
jgi:lipopolysaccharide export system protein LptA